jgi:alpha-ketoglutarate-dependent taurine dioxygenase
MNVGLYDFCKVGKAVGDIWTTPEYIETLEKAREIYDSNDVTYTYTVFSNKNTARIPDDDMFWHADIPNDETRPYPIRMLWCKDNPNTENSGKTFWLNIVLKDCQPFLRPDQVALLEPGRVKIEQQSWHRPGTEIRVYDFVKTHPVTGAKSLRLNAFNDPANGITDNWITRVWIDGQEQPDCGLIADFIKTLENVPELRYEHTWGKDDLAIYDNWSFIHGRTAINLEHDSDERLFFRLNVHHNPKLYISDEE